jgi:hypothetical protein
MSKSILQVGYHQLIMDTNLAMTLFKLLNREQIYLKDSTYEVNEHGKTVEIIKAKPFNHETVVRGLNEADFALWKIAGAE